MTPETVEKTILSLAADLGLQEGHVLPGMALMAEFKRIGAPPEAIKGALDAMHAKGWLSGKEMLTAEGYAQIA